MSNWPGAPPPTGEPNNAAPPVPLSEEVLRCRFCDYTCPTVYANASDKKRAPHDGHNRLTNHVAQEHYAERRALGGRSTSADVRGFEPRE